MICMSIEKNQQNLLHQSFIPQHSRQVKGHSESGFPARVHLSTEWYLMLCLPRSEQRESFSQKKKSNTASFFKVGLF